MSQFNSKDIAALALILGVVSASSAQADNLGKSTITSGSFMVAQANSTDKSGSPAACGKGSCGTDEKGAKKHKHGHKARQERRAERKARRQAKEHVGAPSNSPAPSPAPAPQQ
jgi:hypothetical protein